MNHQELYIEALIFSSSESISLIEIQQTLKSIENFESIDTHQIALSIEGIRARYQDNRFAVELVQLNNGYQFLTKKITYPAVNQLQLQRSTRRLSMASLETLAIIAYNQPVTKLEIEQIRGVNCDYTIQKLIDKELIVIHGKAETPGKPLLYATSPSFMDYFGINTRSDLPQLSDFKSYSNTIGTENY